MVTSGDLWYEISVWDAKDFCLRMSKLLTRGLSTQERSYNDMIRASQKLSKERHTSWREWVAGMQEKIAAWWQDTMPACIRQEVQNLEAIEGMIHELLQRCGQALVTHWVTAQVADATGRLRSGATRIGARDSLRIGECPVRIYYHILDLKGEVHPSYATSYLLAAENNKAVAELLGHASLTGEQLRIEHPRIEQTADFFVMSSNFLPPVQRVTDKA
jgi:hypothetical protein